MSTQRSKRWHIKWLNIKTYVIYQVPWSLRQQGADLSKKDRQGKSVIESAGRAIAPDITTATEEQKTVLREVAREFSTYVKFLEGDKPDQYATNDQWEAAECGSRDKHWLVK